MEIAVAQPSLRSLRRQWLLALLIALLSLLGGYALLTRTVFAPSALRWLVLAGVAVAVVLAILYRTLPYNHRPGESDLFTTLGPATWMTYSSGLLIAWLAGFLFSPWPTGWLAWLPALLYLASRLIDLFDGYAARVGNRVTRSGAMLDIEFDGLGLLVAVLLAVQYGQIPAWYLPLAVSRQLFVAGIWWRKRRNKPVHDLPPSDNRRITAGCQTSFVVAMLWPILAPPATTLAAALFAIPLLASFGRDWLVVSGVVDADSPRYLRYRSRLKNIMEGWLPFAARIVGAALAVLLLARAAPSFTAWEVYFYGLGGIQNLRATATAAAVLFAIALPFFTLGIVGRLAAISIMLVAMLDIQASGMEWGGNALIFASGFVVFHFGSGCCGLWQPEERILHTPMGTSKPVR